MRRIRLVVEYEGSRYVGWQIQPNGLSVQQVVEAALEKIAGEPVRLHSSGRTDAGVHARGMVAHFDTRSELPLGAFREGCNHHLPGDVAVRQAEEVPPSFHARFSAQGKWYRYTICQAEVRSPLHERFSWLIRKPLDEQAMEQAARFFVGEHDFAAFRTTGCAAATTIRRIFSVQTVRQGRLLHIDVKGEGFLKNMVRVMVGTLVEVGQGRRPTEDVAQLLMSAPEISSGQTAPAKGLCLMEVWY